MLERPVPTAAEPADDAVGDALSWGLPPAEIAALRQVLRRGSGGFGGVWPDNCRAVDAFLAGASQWRTGIAMAEGRLATLFLGLDYAAVKIALDAEGIMLSGDLLRRLQVMESAARDGLNGARS